MSAVAPRRAARSFPFSLRLVGIVLLAGLMALPVAAGSALVFAYWQQGAIVPGVRVGGVAVGRLHPRAAMDRLRGHLQQSPGVAVQAGGITLTVTYDELGIEPDVAATVAAARAVGRTGPPWERARSALHASRYGWSIPLRRHVDGERFARAVDELARRLAQPPRNARLHPAPDGSVRVEPHAPSVSIPAHQLSALIMEAVDRGTNRVALREGVVTPPVTEQTLRAWGVDALLAEFETRFDPRETSRAHNIRLAAAALDGTVIPPGGRFSFNELVGPRTPDRGYRPAPVIVAGELVDDFGGGVCQVSTTVYNAALLAGLHVPVRTPHSMPVDYVPRGRDAAVVYGAVDLAFSNPFSTPLVIQTEVAGDRVKVQLFGPRAQRRAFELRTVETVIPAPVRRVADPGLAPGERREVERGRTGYRVQLLRLEVPAPGSPAPGRPDDGARPEMIAISHYRPRARVIAVAPDDV